MIKELHIHHYRKLKNLKIDFTKGLNIVSGTNGTCKSSILYLVANAFQDIAKEDWEGLLFAKQTNDKWNPKIENLTKGDKTYNDPARNKDGTTTKGTLVTAEYWDDNFHSINFRRHNSKQQKNEPRYRLVPPYVQDSNIYLPKRPRIYLGTSRLTSFGEIQSTSSLQDKIIDIKSLLQGQDSILDKVEKIEKNLSQHSSKKNKIPEKYLKDLSDLYYRLTGHKISTESIKMSEIKNIKTRLDFETTTNGVDSNTISSGEDNLVIILYALVSLKFYYENTTLENKSSLLLIDELDATLHPNMQIKILKILREYSQNYEIQIIATTHSLSLLEAAYNYKDNIIYLREIGGSQIEILTREQSNPAVIASQLLAQDRSEIYQNKYIAFFVEDEEAKTLIDLIFNYYLTNQNGTYDTFSKINRFFFPIVAKLGCNQIRDIVNKMPSWAMFAILDQDEKEDIANRIIRLPGDKMSPEKMIHQYYIRQLKDDSTSHFWYENIDISTEKLNDAFLELEKSLEDSKNNLGQKERDIYKKHFKDYKNLYVLLFKSWMHEHPDEMKKFYNNLSKMFNKVAGNAGIYERMKEI